MHDAECRIQLITVSFMFGLAIQVISALLNNAFCLDKNFKIVGEKPNLYRNRKTRSKLGSAWFLSFRVFQILAMKLNLIFPLSYKGTDSVSPISDVVKLLQSSFFLILSIYWLIERLMLSLYCKLFHLPLCPSVQPSVHPSVCHYLSLVFIHVIVVVVVF